MAKGYKDFLDDAEARVRSVEPAALLRDANTVLVDIRDPREIERDGMIEGAFHAPRGMLEFWIDPESPYHKPIFAEQKTFVFYCASGWRSLLAAQVAQDMGLDVLNLRGGLKQWKEEGFAVIEKPTRT